jgi:hypothetical protein
LFSGINKDIWVVGSSIIQRAGEHSKIRPTGTFLGLQQLGCQLVWVGMPGMRWENVVPLIHSLINYRGIPFAVIIHCGGNDIGLVPCGELLFHIKFTIAILSSMLPGTSLVWSSILPRMKWRYSENIRNMEITRKRVNRGVRSYLLKIGGYVIRHPDFDDKHPALFKKDGVHLSFIANDIFLNQIQGALETFLKYPYCLVYPFN